ncbi:SPW repeat protein [Actinomadura rugatobispora]|uniref:SPW repeat protein n=1 Tax=Actinomadura rugatobispora TaxID=1994 RepID=A0ABW1ACK4_9ACTN|nr:SPW repeat protein [Actinomadura rugatobispora]
MTSRTAGIGAHPDLVELRSHYEMAAEQPAARALDGLIILSGLYLALSPWILGFGRFGGTGDLQVNNLITGLAVAAMAMGLAAAFGRTHGVAWTVPLIGVWTIIAPWVVSGASPKGGTIISNVIVGALIVVLGIGAAALPARSHR